MNNEKFWEYALLFLSASLASVYKYFAQQQNGIKLLVTQLLFGCFIAFIAVPYLSEIMTLSYKGSLFFVWVLTFFSDNTLKAFFKMVFKNIDSEESQKKDDHEGN